MKQKELMVYRVVNVNTENGTMVSGDTISLDDLLPLGIELQGDDMYALGKAFLLWRSKSMEIIYRKKSSQRALVIFSRLDSEIYFRSGDILGPIVWSDKDLEFFQEEQQKDQEKEITINFDKLLEDVSSEKDGYLVSFLRHIYRINPEKNKVILEGTVAAYLFLLVIDWFAGEGTMIMYHNDPLV